MDCERARLLLDAYIDGELSEEEMRSLRDHAMACEDCKRELEAAEMLRDVLADMNDEVAVPLQAQAAWRNAVRTEAKKKNMRRWMRAAYAAAAALVLVVGAAVAFNGVPVENNAVVTLDAGASKAAKIIEADGSQPMALQASGDSGIHYSAKKKISTNAPEEARNKLGMLAAEYSGSYMEDAQGICRVELPYEYMEDFLNAASRIGTEMYSEILNEDVETAVILIQICEE